MASPADVVIQQITGVAPGGFHTRDANAVASKSGTRYMTGDLYDSSLTTHPVPIPVNDGGVSGSYWVTHCIYCSDAPDTYLKNLRYYQGDWSVGSRADWNLGSSNSLPAGLYIGISSSTLADARLATQGFISGNYDQADGVEKVRGYTLSSNTDGHTVYKYSAIPNALSGGMVIIDKFDTLGNAYMVQSGQIIDDDLANGARSYCIVTQVQVGSGAAAGNKSDKTATFCYSEA